ncbi:SDR family NAD(P)-dependent oxidoreductase [Labrys wisconsinensis]|uniref:NAD(P)-dependent dehydrogenase (Short-subunit alcohol dehydrogenase family) n=1 Tax=Labrys wisconsinensis TaxID=425677 RepID=A0ABU0JIA1_9HYPH|nr:SDR family NAD(P)-dependent oxidoreductase [Labrys wisconsinensis]MDQ0474007.1 NAD(P)-dependent dehydrogenase (short-subunit alcohol dehydrogenase family) [Labrys wisconsinensis]
MKRFEDKVVLVTGASTGIGLETIRRVLAEGGTVYAAHRRRTDGLDLGAARPLHLDVTDEADWGRAIETVTAEAGRLDVLVNNAGVRESGTVEETSLALWHHLIDTNLTSAFLGCRAAVPALRRAGGGAIVNVGSITGIRGTEGMVAYSASKSGLVSMTASLALDLAPDKIRVNCVCPAAIRTRMVTTWLAAAPDEAAAEQAVLRKHPIGRIGEPHEVAGVIAFLASADASFMTGLTIPVDGGRSIR